MALKHDIYTEVVVKVGDKEEVRPIDHFEEPSAFERSRHPLRKAVPKLNPGEEAVYCVDGSIIIARAR